MSGLTKQIDDNTNNLDIFFDNQKASKRQNNFLSESFSFPLRRSQRSYADVIVTKKIDSALIPPVKWVIEAIPRQKLKDYASKGDAYIEKILGSRIEWAIESIPRQKLKDYASKGDTHIEKILDSHVEWAIEAISGSQLKDYASKSDTNIGKILDSHVEWAIEAISGSQLKDYVSKSDTNIGKILDSCSERLIRMISEDSLKRYASGGNSNIERILNSGSDRAIIFIPSQQLKDYISESDNSIEKILSSRSEWLIGIIPVDTLRAYTDSEDESKIEKILESCSEWAIKMIPGYALRDYANANNEFNIEVILASRAERAIRMIPRNVLEVYVNSDDEFNIEKILESRSEWAIKMIPEDVLSAYASKADINIKHLLNSRSEWAINLVSKDELISYAGKDDVNIANILNSRSNRAIDLLSNEQLRNYASQGEANIDNIIYSRSSRAIDLIPLRKLVAYTPKNTAVIKRIIRSKSVANTYSIDRLISYALRGDDDSFISILGNILGSGSDRLIQMVPRDLLKFYARKGDAYLEKILASQSEWAIKIIPENLLEGYITAGEFHLEKILASRVDWVIKLIPVDILLFYASKGVSYLEKVLNSRSEWAIRMIPKDMLKRYARTGGESHLEKILNSRSKWAIRMIPLNEVKSYARAVDATHIRKILNSHSKRVILYIPKGKLIEYANKDKANIDRILESKSVNIVDLISKDSLKRYVSADDFTIEKILESHSEPLIKMIPENLLEAYVNSDDKCNMERALESRSEWAINMISNKKLSRYIATGSDSRLEKILSSRSEWAIDLIPSDKLGAYVRKGQIKIILESRSVKAINLIPNNRLKAYINADDLNIEHILDSQVDKTINLIPDNQLKAYAIQDDFNVENILSSHSSKAIEMIPIHVLKHYINKGNIVRIEKILASGSKQAIKMIPVNSLKNYAKGSNARIEKLLSTGSNEIIKLIPYDNLLLCIYKMRARVKNRVSFLERQDKSADFLDHEEIAKIEEMLASPKHIDFHILEKFRAYAKGDDTHIGKILGSRSERIINLISDTQLASYARKGNKYIKNILRSRSDRAISFISSVQFNNYVERGSKDKNVIIQTILNSRSERVIRLITAQLGSYANKGDINIENILNSRSDGAMSLISDEKLRTYASKNPANVEKVLSTGSDHTINRIAYELAIYADQGGDAHIEKILASQSNKAISLIIEQLKAYVNQNYDVVRIGRILGSRSEKAIDLIPLQLLKNYAERGDVSCVEQILNSQYSKVMELLSEQHVIAYINRGKSASIKKILNSRFEKLIAMIPTRLLVDYAEKSSSNIEKILSSESDTAIGLISLSQLKAYARLGNANVERIIASRLDRVIKLIPRESLFSYAKTMYLSLEKMESSLSDSSYVHAISHVALEACLPSVSSQRKRSTLIEGCEIFWEDVDRFNEEDEEPREFSKIKINSKQFLFYIQEPSLSESKRAQLLQLAHKVEITGDEKERLKSLLHAQSSLCYLNRINRVASITTNVLMLRNLLRGFVNEDVEDISINLGLCGAATAVNKIAEVVMTEGEALISNSQYLLGQSLKLASPFIARMTSTFIAYDLHSQMKAYQQGDSNALVGIIGDSLYLGVEAEGLGIEIAEIAGTLEGVSAFMGPINAAAGTLILVGMDAYLAAERVKQEDALIHLTGMEKVTEGLLALLGVKPNAYLEGLMEQKQINNQVYRQGLAFLKGHTEIRRYVSTLLIPEKKCEGKVIDLYPIYSVVYHTCTKTGRFETNLRHVVILNDLRSDIQWSRMAPDVPEGNLFCSSFALEDEIGIDPTEGNNYFCENAIGIEYADFRTGNKTLISLGSGNDTVIGFPDSDHLVVLGDGHKYITMGKGDDLFLLNGNRTLGLLTGGGGINTLDLGGFAKESSEVLTLRSVIRIKDDVITIPYFSLDNSSFQNSSLNIKGLLDICQVQHFFFRANKADYFYIEHCDVLFIDARGGGEALGEEDQIYLNGGGIDSNCASNLTVLIRPYTKLFNSDRNKNSTYTYIVPRQEHSAIISLYPACAMHCFLFEASLLELFSFEKDKGNHSSTLSFTFKKSKETITFFNLQITLHEFLACGDKQRLSFQLGDNSEIKILKENFFVYHRTNHSIEDVIRNYPDIANHLNFNMVIYSSSMNESVSIGHRFHDVLQNDPYHRSHLVGGAGENIFVISAGDKDLNLDNQLVIPEITLYGAHSDNGIDTLDLRKIRQKLEVFFESDIKIRVNQDTNDVLIEVFSSEKLQNRLVVVRLKDAITTRYYERLHVILNRATMEFAGLFLKPRPLKLILSRNSIIINPSDIEENTTLSISEKRGIYRFLRYGETDLMITNGFDRSSLEKERYMFLLKYFYQVSKFKSIVIEFTDKRLVLKDEIDAIDRAADFLSEHKHHGVTIANEVNNLLMDSTIFTAADLWSNYNSTIHKENDLLEIRDFLSERKFHTLAIAEGNEAGSMLERPLLMDTSIDLLLKQVAATEGLIGVFCDFVKKRLGQYYIRSTLQEQEVNSRLANEIVNFLKKHPDIYRYILPTLKIQAACHPDPTKKEVVIKDTRVKDSKYKHCAYEVSTTELNNRIVLDYKRKDIKWRRAEPKVTEGSFFCVPAGNELETPSEGAYFCDKAMGIEYSEFRTGNITLIELAAGNNTVIGFPNGDHIVLLGDGYKHVTLGKGDDTFLLMGTLASGSVLDGGDGINALDLRGFSPDERLIIVEVKLNQSNSTAVVLKKLDKSIYDYVPCFLAITGIARLFSRAKKKDLINLCSDSIHYVDGRGGEDSFSWDEISIDSATDCYGNDWVSHHHYSLTLVVHPYTSIINSAEKGEFTYIISRSRTGSGREMARVMLTDNAATSHRFLFNYTLYELFSLKKIITADKEWVLIFGLTEAVNNTKLKEAFMFSIYPATDNSQYQLSDGTVLKINHRGFAVFQTTNSSVKRILEDYPYMAKCLNTTMFVKSLLSNESVRISDKGHSVLSNDPYRRSYLIGNGRENIFIIRSGRRVLSINKLPLPEVVLYGEDDQNVIDILHFDEIKDQLQKDINKKIQIRVSLEGNDILLRLFTPALPREDLVCVRLKDALVMNRWMRRLHIVFDHVRTRKFYRLGTHLRMDNVLHVNLISSDHEEIKASVSRAGRSHSNIRVPEERIEGTESSKSIWETVSSYASYLLPVMGIFGGIGGMGYRYHMRQRLQSVTVLQATAVMTPLLPQAKAKQQTLGDSTPNQIYAKGAEKSADGMASQAVFFKWLFYRLGWRTVVKRMNKAENSLAPKTDQANALDLAIQRVQKVVPIINQSNRSNWVAERSSSAFFPRVSGLSGLTTNDSRVNGSLIEEYPRIGIK